MPAEKLGTDSQTMDLLLSADPDLLQLLAAEMLTYANRPWIHIWQMRIIRGPKII